MTFEEMEAKAELFFEFPTEQRGSVTYTSAILFAMKCVKDEKEGKNE
jgi:hypothetical protein